MRRFLVLSLLLVNVLFDSGRSMAHDALTARKSDPATSSSLEVSRSVDTMTRRVLDLHARYQLTADTDGKRTALRDLAVAAATREQYLASIIDEQPAEVIRAAVSARARAALPPEVQRHVEEDVATDGDLEVLHEDGPSGSRYHYFLNRGADRLTLHFAAEAPILQTGDRVRVSGVRVQQAMALQSGTSHVTLQAAALPNTFGAQKTAVILVNFQDKPTDTWVTPAQVHTIMFAADNWRSVTNFYREASYGQAWLEGDVYGVYTIPMNSTSSCSYGSIASYAKKAATSQVGATKMSTYRRFVYAFPRIGCPWGGLGTVGGNPSEAWINGTPSSSLVSHEMGHNFGLWHSHSLYCDNGRSACSNGTSTEYGDTFDIMGNGSGPMHFNAVQKELLGWLGYGDSPPITTVQSSGTYTIDPYETATANPKALKVKTPSGDWYYVEYRQPLGFDSTLMYNQNVQNGVVVHFWPRNQNPDGIYLLNMRPIENDWTYPALEVGSRFSDAASGLSIAPVWADGTAGVTVSLGGGDSCVRRLPTVKVSPAKQQGQPGSAVAYTVSVTNNDTGCTSASFNQQTTVPAGWSATFGAPTLAIAAGATASTSLQVTSAASAAAGPYTVSPKSSNSSVPANSASTTATYDVQDGGAAGTFTDNFNRADSATLGNGWARVSGALGIQGNRAISPPVKATNTVTQPGLIGQVQTIAASFTSGGNNSAPEFALLARYKSAGNYYMCSRRTGGTSVLRISRVVGGVETVLGAVGVANPATGASFSLGCQVEGTSLTMTLNGARKLTVSDPTFATGTVGMSLGYRGMSTGTVASTWVDDFSATVR